MVPSSSTRRSTVAVLTIAVTPVGDRIRRFWAFYRRYTDTTAHTAATVALTMFGLLVFVDPWFAAIAIACYVVPPLALYVLEDEPGFDEQADDERPDEQWAATPDERPNSDRTRDSSERPTSPALDSSGRVRDDGDTDSDSDGGNGDTDSDGDDGDTDTDSDDGDTDTDSDSDDGDTDSDGDDGDTDSDG
ncbi:hypothetical protein [Halopiger goleimassiliensis]|uniref:hypothetical protein n=1 Tax=Halopiger goleimassiliensis TaxID=1293048 RepID=UPI0006781FE0|nr:hypothetical protein [Halopiger goleimassiliensis]